MFLEIHLEGFRDHEHEIEGVGPAVAAAVVVRQHRPGLAQEGAAVAHRFGVQLLLPVHVDEVSAEVGHQSGEKLTREPPLVPRPRRVLNVCLCLGWEGNQAQTRLNCRVGLVHPIVALFSEGSNSVRWEGRVGTVQGEGWRMK